ncbi:hypothetical protein [Okeania sp. SIO1I7]|nr:hypothetical protein [Okeania sp. SIO1I7]NET26371.1 hypothetical protein [Okeania sp. SIO1I7]
MTIGLTSDRSSTNSQKQAIALQSTAKNKRSLFNQQPKTDLLDRHS